MALLMPLEASICGIATPHGPHSSSKGKLFSSISLQAGPSSLMHSQKLPARACPLGAISSLGYAPFSGSEPGLAGLSPNKRSMNQLNASNSSSCILVSVANDKENVVRGVEASPFLDEIGPIVPSGKVNDVEHFKLKNEEGSVVPEWRQSDLSEDIFVLHPRALAAADAVNVSDSSWLAFDWRALHSTMDAGRTSQLERPQILAMDNLDPGAMTATQAVQASPPPKQEEKKLGDDYHVNVGYAIRTLRDEIPSLFYKEMTYSIFRDDITFQDPLNSFSGMDNYKLIFWALRFHGKIFFKALWVDVNRIWQPNDNILMVRWSIRGIPRVPWEAQGRFDGTSEYRLDKNGKIYLHKVDNVVMDNFRKYQPLTVIEMLRLSGSRSTPPVSSFIKSLNPSKLIPLIWAFTWVRFYSALVGTLFLKDKLQCPGF